MRQWDLRGITVPGVLEGSGPEAPITEWAAALKVADPPSPVPTLVGEPAGAMSRAFLNQLPTILWTTDRDLRFTSFLGADVSEVGLGPNQVVGARVADCLGPEATDLHRRALAGETVGAAADLAGVRLHVRLAPISDAEGVTIGAAGVGHIAGELPREEGADGIPESELLRALVDASDDAIVGATVDGEVVSWNPGAERLYGYRAEEMIGRPMATLVPPGRDLEAMDLLDRLRRGERVHHFDTVRRRKDGSLFHASVTISPVTDAGGTVRWVASTSRDITARKQAQEQVSFLAYHDKLTGLPNRAMFEEHLELGLARARRTGAAVAVLFLDVDNFKTVNDSLGHPAGDELLLQMAARLRKAARETDLVARQGGDEFLLLLADLSTSESPGGVRATAEVVAARVHEAMFQPFSVHGSEVSATVSIGVALYPLHGEDAGGVLRSADSAMYRSKWAGPAGTVVYETTQAVSKQSVATGLRKAAEGGHWVLHYQPIVELERGAIVGVEALLRWRPPAGDIVLPAGFLALAEDLGLSEAIGRWVMREACRQAREWRDMGLDLVTAVNLSDRQLRGGALVEQIPAEIEDAGLEPSTIVLEVSEAATMAQPVRSQAVLESLHDHGMVLAIDDFGTGYSSLSRLQDLPVGILKIDRSFVADLPGDPNAVAMVTAIVQLARTLGMEPAAEGIETDDQWRFLTDLGCGTGQGYRFGHPLPAEDLTSILLAPQPAGIAG